MKADRMRLNRIRVPLVSLVLLALAGCLAIPTPEHSLKAGHGQIKRKDLAPLKVGVTTREDVLLRFGEPDAITPDECIMAYWWRVISGYFCVGAPYGGGAAGPYCKDYILMFEFDPQSRLTRFTHSGSFTVESELTPSQWKASAHDREAGPGQKVIVIALPLNTYLGPGAVGGVTSAPVRFRVGEFRYLPADQGGGTRIGYREGAWGVPSAYMVLTRPPAEVVRSAVIAQLEAAGHQLVFSNADVSIACDIAAFGVSESLGAFAWEGYSVLDVTLAIKADTENARTITRHFQAKHGTGVGVLFEWRVSTTPFDRILQMCLQDMQEQIANDAELVGFLARQGERKQRGRRPAF
jgi:hypothetical protein